VAKIFLCHLIDGNYDKRDSISMAIVVQRVNVFPVKALDKTWQQNWGPRIFPMFLIQIYLTFTVLLFAFGPWPWPVFNPVKLYSFLILAQIALLIGYVKGFSNRPTLYIGRWSWQKLFKIGFWLNVLWIIPNINNRLKLESFDPYTSISMFKLGLLNPGAAYKIRQSEDIIGGSPIAILTVVIAPLLQLLVPIGITYWRQLSLTKKSIFVAFIFIDLSSWIAAGTNQGIAEIILVLPFFIISASPMVIQRIWARRNLLIIASSIIFVIAFVSFFSKGMEGRLGNKMPLFNVGAGINADKSNFMFEMWEGKEGIIMLSSYLTQGYYGLALSLEQPFHWCYGLGHSYYLPKWFKKFIPSSDLDMHNYPGMINTYDGWSDSLRFDSIYPWLASDVTFPGTIIVMFLFGYLLSKLWQDILWCKNPIALALSGILVLLLFYIPLNNRLGYSTTGIAFWVLLIWWRRTRRIIYT
jgi:hypothetical protein